MGITNCGHPYCGSDCMAEPPVEALEDLLHAVALRQCYVCDKALPIGEGIQMWVEGEQLTLLCLPCTEKCIEAVSVKLRQVAHQVHARTPVVQHACEG